MKRKSELDATLSPEHVLDIGSKFLYTGKLEGKNIPGQCWVVTNIREVEAQRGINVIIEYDPEITPCAHSHKFHYGIFTDYKVLN